MLANLIDSIFLKSEYLLNIWSNIILWLTIIFFVYKCLVYAIDVFGRFWSIKSDGKAVLITGCGAGFGNQLALRLNSLGFRVYATVLHPDSDGSKSLVELCRFKDQMVVLKLDVTSDDDIRDVYSKVKTDLIENNCILWSVVNNAGIGILAQLEWMEMDQFRDLFEVNLFGMMQVTKKFLGLVKKSKGRIVNISSVVGLQTFNGFGAYSMTKFAIRAYSDALRMELAKFNVRVCSIFPTGFKDTNFISSTINSADRVWNQLNSNVKNEYGGQQYYNNWLNRQKFYLDQSPKGICQVIDTISDAVTNFYPKNIYYVHGSALAYIGFIVISSCPTFITNYIVNF